MGKARSSCSCVAYPSLPNFLRGVGEGRTARVGRECREAGGRSSPASELARPTPTAAGAQRRTAQPTAGATTAAALPPGHRVVDDVGGVVLALVLGKPAGVAWRMGGWMAGEAGGEVGRRPRLKLRASARPPMQQPAPLLSLPARTRGLDAADHEHVAVGQGAGAGVPAVAGHLHQRQALLVVVVVAEPLQVLHRTAGGWRGGGQVVQE